MLLPQPVIVFSSSAALQALLNYSVNGSPSYTSTIAEYKDGNWKNVGNLAQARCCYSAITSGSITMVVGGMMESPSSNNSE